MLNPLKKENGHVHHIIPKSMDASLKKDKNNLVVLSYREHFVCHLLLPKFCKNPLHKGKMYISLKRLTNSKNYDGVFISSKTFEFISNQDRLSKIELASDPEFYKRMSASQSIAQSRPETRDKRRVAMKSFYEKETEKDATLRRHKIKEACNKEDYRVKQSQIQKEVYKNNPQLREAISRRQKGRKLSIESRDKMSKSQKEKWTEEMRSQYSMIQSRIQGSVEAKQKAKDRTTELWKDPSYVERQRKSHLEVVKSPEHSRKISEAGRKRWKENPQDKITYSVKFSGGNNPRAKKVVAFDDFGFESDPFLCQKDGGAWAKCSTESILKVLKGLQTYAGKHPETKLKLKWRLVSEDKKG